MAPVNVFKPRDQWLVTAYTVLLSNAITIQEIGQQIETLNLH